MTFADLMGLLMSFFVMLTAYSTMDQKKLQMVAGSMAQAFGTLKESRFSGVIEIEGVPTRPNLKYVENVDVSHATDHPAPRLRDVKMDGKTESRHRAAPDLGGRLDPPGAAGEPGILRPVEQFARRGDARGA